VPLTLYTRADCPLCDEMKAELDRAGVADRYTLAVVDIDTDPDLVAAYGRSVPVLLIGDRTAFKGRMTAADFRRKLARLASEPRTGGPGQAEPL